MYYCPDCGNEFENPKKIKETHDLSTPPYETVFICPVCNGRSFYEKNGTHCRCCGARLAQSKTDYCSGACREKGIKLWQKQRQRRKSSRISPLNLIIKEINDYNRINKTDYSYGQYVALIKSKERGAQPRCSRKKSNI